MRPFRPRSRKDAARQLQKRRQKTGLPPGSIVFFGEERSAPTTFRTITYDSDDLEEQEHPDAVEVLAFKDTPETTWIDVVGVHNERVIQTLGEHFGIHPLLLEDIVSTGQRPKVEEYDDYLFIVLRMMYHDEASDALRSEQVSLVVGERYVLCFQEVPGDVFEPVRQRLRAGRGRIRASGASYLAYALVDVVVDHYFTVLDLFGIRAEEMEDAILINPEPRLQGDLNALRRDLVHLRRAVWPVRDMVSGLERSESPLVDEMVRPFLRDTYDHVVQVIEIAESLREMLSSLHDLYMSNLSHRMNEVMKVLTIIGTIFIPLTFIAGIYGMNFDHMPELHWRYGYPIMMSLMLAIGLALVAYFRRKDWL